MKTIKHGFPGSRPPSSTLVGGPVWQLHGSTEKDVLCLVEYVRHSWAVSLVRGGETMLNEVYPDMSAALAGAERLKDHLMGKGWVPVPIDERQIAVAMLVASLREADEP
jgi:hypothetical protein